MTSGNPSVTSKMVTGIGETGKEQPHRQTLLQQVLLSGSLQIGNQGGLGRVNHGKGDCP